MTWVQWLGLITLGSPVLLLACFRVLFGPWAEFTKTMRGPVHWWIVLLIGAIADLYVNLVWGTLLFLKLPNVNRVYLSARMDDLIKTGSGYRKWLAIQIVGRLLEPYDRTGQHTTYGQFARS